MVLVLALCARSEPLADVLGRQAAAFRSVDSPWCCSESPDRCKLPEHRALGACGLWDFWRPIVGGFEVDVLARQAAAYREAWAYFEAAARLRASAEDALSHRDLGRAVPGGTQPRDPALALAPLAESDGQ